MSVQASWNPLTDLQLLFQYHFMHNAFLAGTIVAVTAGAIGYFMVLRGQSFAGHALAHVGFAGATGALLVGLTPVVGLLSVGIAAALGISVLDLEQKGKSDGSALAIGAVYTFCLGLGVLFLQLYSGQAETAYSLLFGAVLGIGDADILIVVITACVAILSLSVIARPLLYASIDPEVAAAQRVPVRLLSTVFLVLLAFAVAEAVQVVGILLIFALLVTPAATAQQLTPRPLVAIVLSIALAVVFTWIGLAAAYFAPYPVAGFYITSVAFGAYGMARLMRLGRRGTMALIPRWKGSTA